MIIFEIDVIFLYMKATVHNSNSKLYRSKSDRVVAGVCGGLGKFFQVDSTIVRLIFILITVFGGSGILLYLILWLIVPPENSASEITRENISKNADEMKESVKKFANDIKLDTSHTDSRRLFGIVILIFGVMLLLGNFGFFNPALLWKYFPAIVVIILGISVLRKRG